MGTGKKIWRIAYPLIIWFGAHSIVQYIYLFVKAFEYIGKLGSDALDIFNDPSEFQSVLNSLYDAVLKDSLILTLVCNAVTIAVLLVFYIFDKTKWDKNNLLHKNTVKNPLQYALNIVIAISSCILFNLIMAIVMSLAVSVFGEEILSTYNSVSTSIYNSPIYIQVITAVISAPICEELLMRGLVYKRMRSFMRPLYSALISSVIFGLIHGNWVQFMYAFAVGLIATYIYEYTRTLFAPILFHITANATSTLISLEGVDEYAETLMYGDAFINVTLALTIVCIVTGLIAMSMISKRRLSKQ